MTKSLPAKPALVKVTIEVVSIIFAVLVALAADNWVEDREKQQRKTLLLNNIEKEVAKNANELSTSLKDFEAQIRQLQAVITTLKNDTRVAIDEEIKAVWHVSMPALRNTSWQALTLQSDIFGLIELDKIEQLSSIYSLQKSLDQVSQRLIADFGNNTAHLVNSTNGKSILLAHLYNISAAQQLAHNLNELYSSYLKNTKTQI